MAQSVDIAIAAPALALTAASLTVPLAGGTTLTWAATNSTACTASGGWSGARAVEGSVAVNGLTAATEFRLRCVGPGGAVERLIGVGISAPTLALSSSAAKLDLAARPTLTWSSANATACTATGGWTGAKAVSGSASQEPLSAATTYNLSCTGPGGTVARTVSVGINPAVATLSVDRTTIERNESVTLTWTSRSATSCTAGGGWSGTKASSGSALVEAIEGTVSFTLACTGAGGTSALQTVRVLVRPTATISASATLVAPNSTVTLTWNSAGGSTCVAGGNDPAFQGAVAGSGTRTSSPITGDWSFTLRCTNASGEALATTSVFTAGTSIRWTPPTLLSDGRPIGTIQGYNIYYGRTSGKYEGVAYVPGNVSSGAAPLVRGTWFVTVTAVAQVPALAGGSELRESAYAPELRKTVP